MAGNLRWKRFTRGHVRKEQPGLFCRVQINTAIRILKQMDSWKKAASDYILISMIAEQIKYYFTSETFEQRA